MKVILVGMVILVLTLPSVLWGQGVSKSSLNFTVQKAAKFRCNIRQTSRGPWLLSVVAEDSNEHRIFNYLYSVRKNVTRSMHDCKDWLKAAKKQKDNIEAQQTSHVKGADSPKAKRKAGKRKTAK